MAGFANNALTI